MIYLDVAIMLTLAFCVVRNEDPLRFWVAYCVFSVMAVNILVFYTSFYDAAVGVLGFHVYQSLFECLLALMIAIRPSKLGVLMIGVSILAIFVNALAYWVDLIGDSVLMFEVLMWGLFALQVALLLSKRLTNGIYRSLTSISLIHRILNSVPHGVQKIKG